MEPRKQHEQRRSYRYALSGSPKKVELRIGPERYTGTLADQSADGFAVLLDRFPQAKEGAPVELHTDAGDSEVQIVRVAEERAPAAGGVAGDSAALQYRVGMVRLRDIDRFEPAKVSGRAPRLSHALASMFPASSSMLGFGLVAAVLLALAPILLMVVFGSVLFPPSTRDSSKTVLPYRLVGASEGRPAPAGRASAERAGGPVGVQARAPAHGAAARAAERTETHGDEWQRLLRGAPGPAIFELPEVVHHFRLTHAQQQQIARVVEAAKAALAELSGRAHRFDRAWHAAERQAVLDAARREALEVLDEQQRAQWRRLTE